MQEFNYTPYLGLGRERQFKPLVPLQLIGEKGVVGVSAMIDTGSENNVFSKVYLKTLGLNESDLKEVPLRGLGGMTKTGREATIDLAFQERRWTETVFFTDIDHEDLLGNRGFLDRFNVTFLYSAGVFGVEPVPTLDWQ